MTARVATQSPEGSQGVVLADGPVKPRPVKPANDSSTSSVKERRKKRQANSQAEAGSVPAKNRGRMAELMEMLDKPAVKSATQRGSRKNKAKNRSRNKKRRK